MLRPIHIGSELLAQVYAHAAEAFPDECCGYLVGPVDGTSVDEIVRCRNAQAEGNNPVAPERGADTGFVIDGKDLFALARSFRGDRPARIIYHSHTNGRAYFSDVDQRADREAGYYVQHLVVGVHATGFTEAALFVWTDTDHRYVELARWSLA